LALAIAERLDKQGIAVTVVDPRWVLPVSDALVKIADKFALVVTLEDGGVHGGIGSTVSAALRAAGVHTACRDMGVPQQFLDHASREAIHQELGLTAQDLSLKITGWVASMGGSAVHVQGDAPARGDAPAQG
jgi:1-deoxy-D-xylulose-5-phosphate synthase